MILRPENCLIRDTLRDYARGRLARSKKLGRFCLTEPHPGAIAGH